MGQSNWFWPRILAQFVDESEHFGGFIDESEHSRGFTNGELSHQARANTHFFI
jgi:hypothetical protein